MHRRLVIGAIAAISLSLVGCTGGHGKSHAVAMTPDAMCRAAFGSNYINAAAGKVSDVRTLSVSIAAPAHPRAFPSAATNDPVAWCWTGAPQNYVLYAVRPGDSHIRVEGLAGPNEGSPPEPGPAAIP